MDTFDDALKQFDALASAPAVPVILPLSAPANRAANEATRGCGYQAIVRFSFPELTEPNECVAAPAAPTVTWPDCHTAETVCACAKAAGAILGHLSFDRPRMVMFTSPGDGDGKTSLLIALAPELARLAAGSVLAVDANFHKPDLTLRLSASAGNMLAGASLIYPTNLPHLNFLPARAEERSKFVDSDSAASEELREGWSLVLLDAPSLAHREAVPMVQHCDGVYLVVRVGHTVRRAVADAARVIRSAGGRLLGCLVVA